MRARPLSDTEASALSAETDPASESYRYHCSLWLLRAVLSTRSGWRGISSENDLQEFLGISPPGRQKDAEGEPDDDEARSEAAARTWKRAMAGRLGELERMPPDRNAPLFRNLDWLQSALGMDKTDKDLLAFAVLLHHQLFMRESVSGLNIRLRSKDAVCYCLARLIDRTPQEVRCSLSAKGALNETRLLTFDRSCGDLEGILELNDAAAKALLEEHASGEDLMRCFFADSPRPNLTENDITHLANDFQIVTGILASALAAREKGVNVLLYGGPGAGKTEFARLAAARLGAPLYVVASEDSDGDAMKANRVSAYVIGQRLLAKGASSLVLFDEIEDVFPHSDTLFFAFFQRSRQEATVGKAWVNRLLESNPIPAIWISNSVEQIDPAYLRRFDYSVEFPTPPRSVRQRIVENHLAGTAVSDRWKSRAAEYAELTPAQIEKTARVLKLVPASAGMDADAVAERALRASMQLLGQSRRRPMRATGEGYSLEFLNTSTDIPALVAGLKARPRGTFCFYGPPGTGKSALAAHIANALDRPIVAKRASDLLSMWLGASERNIARMFRESADEGAVLLLDEADSFLADRRDAKHSWEVTQVNELLTQMEEFEGIFICTTNLMDRLDQASLRRFAFKVHFHYLRQEQRWRMFEQELVRFGGSLPDDYLAVRRRVQQLGTLTPGDFATIGKQISVLGQVPQANGLIDALENECTAKGEKLSAIGFLTTMQK